MFVRRHDISCATRITGEIAQKCRSRRWVRAARLFSYVCVPGFCGGEFAAFAPGGAGLVGEGFAGRDGDQGEAIGWGVFEALDIRDDERAGDVAIRRKLGLPVGEPAFGGALLPLAALACAL